MNFPRFASVAFRRSSPLRAIIDPNAKPKPVLKSDAVRITPELIQEIYQMTPKHDSHFFWGPYNFVRRYWSENTRNKATIVAFSLATAKYFCAYERFDIVNDKSQPTTQ